MTGHLEKRAKSTWTIVIELDPDPQTGQRKRKYERFQGKKQDAQSRMNELLYELQTGGFIEPSEMTVAQYMEKWLDTYAVQKLSPKTIESYRDEIKNHIGPGLKHIPLQDLTALHLEEFYAYELKHGRKKRITKPKEEKPNAKKAKVEEDKPVKKVPAGLSPRTINYHHRIIRRALQRAVRQKLIKTNVARDAEPPTIKQVEMNYIPPDRINTFLNEIRNSKDYAVVAAAIATGMRQGELLGLHWTETNLDTGIIKVRQQLQYLVGQGYSLKEPKSEKSKRDIPISLPLNSLLRKMRKDQLSTITGDDEKELTKEEEAKKLGLVFCQPEGKALNPNRLSHRFKKLAAKAGYPELRFHDLRHTFAAMAIAQEVSMERLQRLMGHQSITTTINTYGHLSKETLKDAMDQISKALVL